MRHDTCAGLGRPCGGAELRAARPLPQMMGIEGVLKNVFDDVFHQMITTNPSGAAGINR
jgi:hypothetical protein